MKLHEIQFPVYLLGENKPVEENSLVYYERIDENKNSIYLIIDDKYIESKNLGIRRLKLRARGIKLFPLKIAVFFIGDFIKLAKGTTWFIDSSGKVFKYRKTKIVPLIFKKISKVIPMKHGGGIIEVEGLHTRYKTLFLPRIECRYAGLLKIGISYILYGLYEDKLKDTRRKI